MKRKGTARRGARSGFTLVELIVVIAVMGILAAVGTVAYNGYVKSVNKKADIALVGNVIRAIETGANTTLFTPPESLSVSATTYPVGFVVVNYNTDDDKATVTIHSETEVDYHEDEETKACEIVEVKYYVRVAKYAWVVIFKGYDFSGPYTVRYCKTHSNPAFLPKIERDTGTYYPNNPKGMKNKPYYYYEDTDDSSKLTKESDVHRDGAVPNKSPTLGSPDIRVDNTGVISDALAAAFGDDYYKTVKLKYSGWSDETGQTFTTLYADGSSLMDTMETLSGQLVDTCNKIYTVYSISSIARSVASSKGYNSADAIVNAVISQPYGSKSALISSFAKETAKKDGSNNTKSFVEYWAEVDASTENNTGYWQRVAFGWANKDREYFCAARQAYNSSFASWLKQNGGAKYVNAVSNFTKPINFGNTGLDDVMDALGIDTELPAIVCRSAFVDADSSLKTDLGEKGAKECLELYNKYVSSGASAANAQAFFDTMVTFADTSDEAAASGSSDNDYFKFLRSYMKEMQELYAKAQAYASNGDSSIIIMINMQDGKVACDVSPSSADPRGK